jgi:hypothetical protein
MSKNFLRSYCIIGINSVEELKEDLTVISETNVNYVSGDGLMIATFKSTFNINEIDELLKLSKKSFIIFEMTPGFYSANLQDEGFQQALFGEHLNLKFPFLKMDEELKNIKNDISNVFDEISVNIYKNFTSKSDEELLKEALENEDYEAAAKLRDKLKNK